MTTDIKELKANLTKCREDLGKVYSAVRADTRASTLSIETSHGLPQARQQVQEAEAALREAFAKGKPKPPEGFEWDEDGRLAEDFYALHVSGGMLVIDFDDGYNCSQQEINIAAILAVLADHLPRSLL